MKIGSSIQIRQTNLFQPFKASHSVAAFKGVQVGENYSAKLPLSEIDSEKLRGSYGLSAICKKSKQKQVAFEGIPLYSVNLKRLSQSGEYKPVAACFSRIKQNADERKVFDKLDELWGNKAVYFSSCIHNDFRYEPNREFYAIELADSKLEPHEKIMSVVEITKPTGEPGDKKLCIDFLQSSPKNINLSTPETKGAGELAMYGVVRLAKELNIPAIELYSTNDSFYEKIAMNEVEKLRNCKYFGLESKDYDKFLNKISKKYKFKQD